MKAVYEKLGLFYLGKDVDRETLAPVEALTLLKNKNFTTHAAIIGMTGSGKTGLGIGIIEEAAIDNIPSIVIDPKGDMGDLCLSDPAFSSEGFEPWVRDEANTQGIDTFEYAGKIAAQWKEGIASFDQDASRVKRFHDVPKTIYTPGSSAGVAINILSSLERPPLQMMKESDSFTAYLKSTVMSLLSLIGIDADPLTSKAYILLAQIVSRAWLAGEEIGIDTLIGKIITPPFQKIGILPLDTFYASDARFQLASRFNALLASPSFSLWLQGESLDIQKLLYDENGKAKIAIFSIAHLNDNERMFFVTLLLNKYSAWMRRQSGTSSLKTLLYMDEIFGYFPPTKNPPSKAPMMVLLKQARAFGVGIVLSTQNPVDLDYKGLSNIGTWFIGRLQTTQDIERVIDGLGGKIGSAFEKREIENILSNLKKRTFFLKSAYLEDLRLFTTRWVLSYLKGPLKRDEIATLMADQKVWSPPREVEERFVGRGATLSTFPLFENTIPCYYEPDPTQQNIYFPTLSVRARVHFFNQRRGIDVERKVSLAWLLDSTQRALDWKEAREEEMDFTTLPHLPPAGAHYYDLPGIISKDKGLKKAVRGIKAYLYRVENLTLFRCRVFKLESKAGESRSEFIVRVKDHLNEKKELEIEKLKRRYAAKEQAAQNRLLRAQERLSRESSEATSSIIEMGISVLSALFGKRTSTTIGRAVSKGGRILKERSEMSRAEAYLAKVQEDIEVLNDQLEEKIDHIDRKYHIEECTLESFKIKPRKTDIVVDQCAIVWRVA